MKEFSFLIFLSVLVIMSCDTKNKNTTSSKTGSYTKTTKPPKGQSNVKDDISAHNALQVAKSLDDFKTLVSAIEAADVEDAVVNVGPLTIFAPVNSAFKKIPKDALENLLKPENKNKLAYVLTNHVAPANYPTSQLIKEAKKGRKLYMASGKYLKVENRKVGIYVGETKILKSVKVSNGWIHVIGDVLVAT